MCIALAHTRLLCVTQASHSRKFREYCSHCIDVDLNKLAVQFLETLVMFQNRMYLRDPIKARAKRRFVVGLREVTKFVARGKVCSHGNAPSHGVHAPVSWHCRMCVFVCRATPQSSFSTIAVFFGASSFAVHLKSCGKVFALLGYYSMLTPGLCG